MKSIYNFLVVYDLKCSWDVNYFFFRIIIVFKYL